MKDGDFPEGLSDLRTILRILAFTCDQFKAPVFEHMLLYAWQRSGYSVDLQVVHFKSANEVMFVVFNQDCSMSECENVAFVQCAHYAKFICCFHCLQPSPHLHIE